MAPPPLETLELSGGTVLTSRLRSTARSPITADTYRFASLSEGDFSGGASAGRPSPSAPRAVRPDGAAVAPRVWAAGAGWSADADDERGGRTSGLGMICVHAGAIAVRASTPTSIMEHTAERAA